jgi:hypothetical protein
LKRAGLTETRTKCPQQRMLPYTRAGGLGAVRGNGGWLKDVNGQGWNLLLYNSGDFLKELRLWV